MILANNGWCALKEQKKEKVGKKWLVHHYSQVQEI